MSVEALCLVGGEIMVSLDDRECRALKRVLVLLFNDWLAL